MSDKLPPDHPDALTAPPPDALLTPSFPGAPPQGTLAQPPDAAARAAESSRPGATTAAVPGYEIEMEVGRGGMGVVYKARQVKLNRPVALKMAIGGRVGDRDLIRFLAEAEAVAAVKHPNVVQVYEYGETEGRPYMALEYLSGGSLADRLKDGTRLDARTAAALVAKVAAGMAAAHEQGIVHRDLKPSNVLLDAAGEPKVADFGIAKRVGSDLTATLAVMGTPSYMAPEQAGGKAKFVGPPADVWALGAMLYECLTGARPFVGVSTDEILAKVLNTEPAALRTLAGDIPLDLELICRKCLEKNPADRYPTAAELADDLGRFCRGEPISIRPAGTVERVYKWTRRNPTRAAAYGLILVAVALIVLTGGAVWLWRDAEGRGVQSEQQRQTAESLRDRETGQRLQELLQAASAAEAEAIDRLRTGRFKEAQDGLNRVIPRLRGEPQLADRLAALEARSRQAKQLENFYAYANLVWLSAWDDDRNSDQLLIDGQAALSSLGILTADGKFANAEWWKNLPDSDLGEDQRARLRGEVYQQLIIIVAPHLREGARPLLKRYEQGGAGALLLGGPLPEAVARLRSGLVYVDQAAAWERSQGAPPSRALALLRKATTFLMVRAGDTAADKGPAPEVGAAPVQGSLNTITAAEHYFFGLLYFNLSQYPNNPTMGLIALVLKDEFEITTPEDTKRRAEESLRQAASLEPNRFWPHFMLGSALLARNDFNGAELAFGNCIRLEPLEPRGYIFRAKAIVRRATLLTGETDKYSVRLRSDLITRGMADRDRAVALAPHMPDIYFAGGELYAALGRTKESLAEYCRYLELEDRTVNARILRRNWLNDIEAVFLALIKNEPTNPDAHAALALVRFRKNDLPGAATAAEKCLQLQPENARALTVRGGTRFQNKEWAGAEADFEHALRLGPSNYFAAYGRALSFERTGDHAKALAAFDALLVPAGPAAAKWQQAEAHLGRSRALTKLDRAAEADAALRAARDTDPRAVVYAQANPPIPRP